MKKIISLITGAVLSAMCAVSAFAEQNVGLILNGEQFETDVPAFIENNRTMVPARAIFEAMGAKVTWDEENKTVLMIHSRENEFTSVVLQIGLDKAFVNNETKELDAPAMIVNNRTFVPLRFIMESFGGNVTWEEETKSVLIVTE